MTQMMLNPSSRIGFVALRVHDLTVMRAWYVQMLGLEVLQDSRHQVLLGLQANHRVLLLLEGGGNISKTPTAGLSAFALSVPTLPVVLKQVAWLHAQGVAVSPWFKTGFSRGVRVNDPEGNEVILEYDEGRAWSWATGTISQMRRANHCRRRTCQKRRDGRHCCPRPRLSAGSWLKRRR